MAGDALNNLLQTTMAEAIAVVDGLTVEQLTRTYQVQNRTASGVEAVLKVTEHFAQEKARCLSMLERNLAKPMDVPWPRAANFPMTGRHWSQLQYKHLNHHLTQFGV